LRAAADRVAAKRRIKIKAVWQSQNFKKELSYRLDEIASFGLDTADERRPLDQRSQ